MAAVLLVTVAGCLSAPTDTQKPTLVFFVDGEFSPSPVEAGTVTTLHVVYRYEGDRHYPWEFQVTVHPRPDGVLEPLGPLAWNGTMPPENRIGHDFRFRALEPGQWEVGIAANMSAFVTGGGAKVIVTGQAMWTDEPAAACVPTGHNGTRHNVTTAMDHGAGTLERGLHAPSQVPAGNPFNVSFALGTREHDVYRFIRLGSNGVQLGQADNGSNLIEFHARWSDGDLGAENTNTRLNITWSDTLPQGAYVLVGCLEHVHTSSYRTLQVEYYNRTVRVA